MSNGANLGDILSAALSKNKEVNMEKIANFYRAAKDLGWSTIEIVGALNTEQFATLEKQILAAVNPNILQRVKLFSRYASNAFWENNKIEAIKLVRNCGQGNTFGLVESKNFCEGHGTLDVNPDELQRLIGLFGRGALDLF
jgi:ribosomal protein L7/L12